MLKKIITLIFIYTCFSCSIFSESYFDKGMKLMKSGNLIEAGKMFEKSADNESNYNTKSDSYNLAGYVYFQLRNYEKALFYFEKALIIDKQIGNMEKIVNDINSLGAIYYKTDKIDKAIEIFQEVMLMAEKNQLDDDIASINNNLGNIYFEKGEFEKAIEYYLESLQIIEKNQLYNYIMESYENIGNTYVKLNNSELARKYFKIGLEKSTELNDEEYIEIFKENLNQ